MDEEVERELPQKRTSSDVNNGVGHPSEATGTTPAKARMSQENRLKYIAPVYAKRLRDTANMMQDYLARKQGTPHEIERRIKVLEELCSMVDHGLHKVAAEYAIQHGLRNSLLQGGGGFPSLTGAHFDYVVTVMPHRTAEMKELIYQRRFTAYKVSDRNPKLPDTEPESPEEPTEDAHETDEPDAA